MLVHKVGNTHKTVSYSVWHIVSAKQMMAKMECGHNSGGRRESCCLQQVGSDCFFSSQEEFGGGIF